MSAKMAANRIRIHARKPETDSGIEVVAIFGNYHNLARARGLWSTLKGVSVFECWDWPFDTL